METKTDTPTMTPPPCGNDFCDGDAVMLYFGTVREGKVIDFDRALCWHCAEIAFWGDNMHFPGCGCPTVAGVPR